MAIKNQFEIDGGQAIATMQAIQQNFLRYNSTLGQVTTQTAAFNAIGNRSRQVLTQINADGTRTRTVVQGIGANYKILSETVSQATASQIKNSQALRDQAALADSLAAKVGNKTPAAPGQAITTGVNTNLVGKSVGDYANLTKAQLEAAATARGLNVAQKAALLDIVPNINKAKTAFDSLRVTTLAFKTALEQVGKIAFATLIYRGISLITQGLSEGAKTALDYGHQIGLIQTISQDSGESFDTWSAAIRKVADELGRPATEVAKDAYDALSNQVIRTTKDFDLLRTSITLEQNTGSQSGTGLSTISALLNGMGLSADHAQILADKLFVTIDKGRVRLEELNSVIGRTVNLQKQAGVNFDETAGALTVLTQAGLDSQESSTLLNNVFSELIKPNKDLTDAVQKLGFATPVAAVQALGLAQALETLGEAAKKTPNGLATFFPDIRGLRGAAILFEQTKNFKKNIEEIQNAGGANKAAKGILDENEAQRILKDAERIKNYFTVDLGSNIVSAIAKISDSFGGFNNVVKALTPVIIGAGAALVAFVSVQSLSSLLTTVGNLTTGFVGVAKAIGVAEASAITFGAAASKSLLLISGAAAAAIVVFLAASFAIDKYSESVAEAANAKIRPVNVQVDNLTTQNKDNGAKRVADFQRSLDAQTSAHGRFVAVIQQQLNGYAAFAKKAYGEAGQALEDSSSVSLNYLRKNLSQLEQAEEDAFDNINKLEANSVRNREELAENLREIQVQNIKDAYEAASKGKFEPDPNQVKVALNAFRDIERASIASAVASRNAFLKTGDTKNAEKEYQKAVQAVKDYKSNVESLGGKVNVGSQLNNLFLGNEAAIKNSQATLATKYEEANKAASAQRLLLEQINTTIKERGDLDNKVFDKEGKLQGEYATNSKKALEDFDAIDAKRKKQQSQVDLSSATPLEKQRVTSSFAKEDTDAAAARSALETQISAVKFGQVLNENLEARGKAVDDLKKKESQLVAQEVASANEIIALIGSIKNLSTSLTDALNSGGQSSFNPGDGLLEALKTSLNSSTLTQDQFTQAEDAIASIQNETTSTLPNVQKLREALEGLKTATASIGQNRLNNPQDTTKTIAFSEAIASLTTKITLLNGAEHDQQTAVQSLAELDQVVSNLNTTNMATLVDLSIDLGKTVGGINGVVGAINAITAADQNAAAAANAAAEAQARLSQNASGGSGSADTGGEVTPAGKAGGGPIGGNDNFLSDFYNGKYAKGTDVVPSMLTPGEFVVRAPMARKFFSQLVAINSNNVPNYRAEGGSTGATNNTSHNYNINVGGGSGTNSDTVKAVVQGIKRAQRQGTIS